MSALGCAWGVANRNGWAVVGCDGHFEFGIRPNQFGHWGSAWSRRVSRDAPRVRPVLGPLMALVMAAAVAATAPPAPGHRYGTRGSEARRALCQAAADILNARAG